MAPVSFELMTDEYALAYGGALGLPVPDDCHPRIQAILDYWLSLHSGEGLPGRQHFDPVDIPTLLPNLWLIDVTHDPIRFRMRLVGTRIAAYAGEDNTGRWIDERWPDYNNAPLKHVMEQRAPSWWRGPSQFRPEKSYFELERVRLPLAQDGVTVDMILCLTVFYDQNGEEVVGGI